jgi:hypothetical protein
MSNYNRINRIKMPIQTPIQTINTTNNITNYSTNDSTKNSTNNSNQLVNITTNQLLNNVSPNSIYNIIKSNITLTLPIITDNSYINFTIINSSDDYIIIETANNNLIYNSLYISKTGESIFYLKNNAMAIVNNFYDSIGNLAWLLILS